MDGAEFNHDFWHQIKDYYERGIYCDMELVPGNSKTGVKCHQLVLASVSRAVRSALKVMLKSNDSDPAYVMLPEFSYEALKVFLDGVYGQLVKEESDGDNFIPEFELNQSLDLRILPGNKNWTKEEILDDPIEVRLKT